MKCLYGYYTDYAYVAVLEEENGIPTKTMEFVSEEEANDYFEGYSCETELQVSEEDSSIIIEERLDFINKEIEETAKEISELEQYLASLRAEKLDILKEIK